MPTTQTPTNTATSWLDPARQSLEAYREGTDRMFAMLPSWEAFATDTESRELARLGGEAARARAAVTRELLISPLWLTGIASPSDLQTKVQDLIDLDRRVGEAWANVFRTQSRRFTGNAHDAVNAAESVLDRSQQFAEKVASAVVSNAASTAAAAEDVSEKATSGAVKAVQALRPVKGNTSRDGEKIFHVPGQSSYEQLTADETFATQSEAIAAGFRIARSRGGPVIKGNIARDGSRVYHKPGQANYDRVDAETLFETDAEAMAEGFRPATR
ncbi:MAG: hypothetical protein ABIP13_02160 [Tepidiformaceae bacterium]